MPQKQQHRFEDFGLGPLEEQNLLEALRKRENILIAGSTGSGKTSFLNTLLGHLQAHERVLILEDSPELPLPNALSSKLLCRNNRFGFREGSHWTLKDLVFESLRMRPDRIVVGECRNEEAQALAQSMSTGHRGAMCTLHAGSCQEALMRFAKLARIEEAEATKLWSRVLYFECDGQGHRRLAESFESGKTL